MKHPRLKSNSLFCVWDTVQAHVPDLHFLPIKGQREVLSGTNECPLWNWPRRIKSLRKFNNYRQMILSLYVSLLQDWIIFCWYRELFPELFDFVFPFSIPSRFSPSKEWKSGNQQTGYKKRGGRGGCGERKKGKKKKKNLLHQEHVCS